ncbi:MAG TPA: radical SAM protein [Polyangiaceae bacterium]|nr:radical SAM protein [Polyangiaceae bacterium]
MPAYLSRAASPLRSVGRSCLSAAAGVRNRWEKLRENQAYDLLLHPEVLLHRVRYVREARTKPLVMKNIPYSLEIELTSRCNLACTQCLRSQGLKPYDIGDIHFEDYRRILAQFPRTMNLFLNGFGEPLMHPEFVDIVEYTRSVLPWAKIGIYSNGTLLREELAARILGSGLTEINVSIDAATPETYRKVRRGGRFDLLHENIRGLLRRRRAAGLKLPLVGVNFVMLNDNEGELVPFLEQAAELGVDFVNCITYASYDWGFQNLRSKQSYQTELAQARAALARLKLPCRAFPSDDLGWCDPERSFDCGFFWGGSLRVTYEGNVTLGCCTPFKETFSYGNLLETPFEEIWNNAAFRRNRECALKGEAPNATCASCLEQCRQFFAPREPQLVKVRRSRA